MNGDSVLSSYNILNQATIDMEIPLFGGKVHGSLARAGKVKGQTPKVKYYLFIRRKEIKNT
jgi:small subunit ribosomal protein S30e